MNKAEVCAQIQRVGVIPAVRVSSAEDALFAADAVFLGGIPVAEIALTVPNATEVIARLSRQHPKAVVGAGGVMNAAAAQACLDAGAQFLTSDGLHLELLRFAASKDIVVFPGVLTPTEVITAGELGCDFVKVVPCAHIGGEAYIRSLHQMFPQIPLIAAGGVSQQTASRYILAGAVALGVGSELIPARDVRHREADRIRELTRRFAGFVKSAREEELPNREGRHIETPHNG